MTMEPAYAYLLCAVGVLSAGGAFCWLVDRLPKGRDWAGPAAAGASLAAFLLGLLAFASPLDALGEYSAGRFALPLIPIDVTFRLSPFIGAVNAFALAFGFLVCLYCLGYSRGPGGRRTSPAAYACSLWAIAGSSVALTTSNLLVLVFAWEVVTLMLYLLIGQGGADARAGAAKTFAILGFSDVMIILGVAGLVAYRGPGALSMSLLEGPLHVTIVRWQEAGLYLLLLVGALAKAGAFPLHTWIPSAAEHAPVPVMALLPACLDKLLGIVLLARISLGFFTLGEGLRLLVMCIGAVTIIGAVMMAMVQHELKRLLSFHAVSQVGYMVLGVGTGVPVGVVGGLFHMINHATYKSLLFLAGGAVETRTGDLELDHLGGLSKAMPLTFASFVVGSLAISGVPPLNGFVSKWLVYQGVLEGGGQLMPLLLAAAVAGSALTLASFVKAIHSVFLGERSPTVKDLQPEPREVGRSMLLPMGTLALLCVALGLGSAVAVDGFLAPSHLQAEGLQVAGLSHTGTASLALQTGSWVPLGAALLLVLGLVLGLAFYAVGRAFRTRKASSFIGGETTTPAPTHMSGTGFYLTIKDLPVIRGFYGNAEGEAFDVYRLGGQFGSRVVEFLRGLHTGILETYVTWVLAGAAAIVLLVLALL